MLYKWLSDAEIRTRDSKIIFRFFRVSSDQREEESSGDSQQQFCDEYSSYG